VSQVQGGEVILWKKYMEFEKEFEDAEELYRVWTAN